MVLDPDARGLEQMSDVVVKNLIGGNKDACIDAKAMQSRMLFFFSVHLLNQIAPRLRGDLRKTAEGLAKKTACLVEWFNIILSKSGAFSVDVCNNAINLAKKQPQDQHRNPNTTPLWILAGRCIDSGILHGGQRIAMSR